MMYIYNEFQEAEVKYGIFSIAGFKTTDHHALSEVKVKK